MSRPFPIFPDTAEQAGALGGQHGFEGFEYYCTRRAQHTLEGPICRDPGPSTPHIDNQFTTTARDETELTVDGDWLDNSPPLTP